MVYIGPFDKRYTKNKLGGMAFNMRNDIMKTQTPENLELNKKLIELSALETELTPKELDLATLQAELNTFEIKYEIK